MSDHPRFTTGKMLRLGMRGRCPRCGQGRIFEGYLKVAGKCPSCGLRLAGHDTGDAPVVPLIIVLGGAIVGLALLLEVQFSPPLWVHAVIWLPLVVIVTLAVLPVVKGLNIALQHRYRSTEEDTPVGGT